jgi:hypothetical protein
MDRLDDRIQRELRRVTPSGTSAMIAIVRAWPGVVGDENARRAWPARLARDGTLHVNATDSIWAFQLGLLAESILERLREELGDATPPALRFVAGPVPEPAAEPPDRRLPEPPQVAAADARRGRSLAAGIEDKELRELVARAAAASLAKARLEGL